MRISVNEVTNLQSLLFARVDTTTCITQHATVVYQTIVDDKMCAVLHVANIHPLVLLRFGPGGWGRRNVRM